MIRSPVMPGYRRWNDDQLTKAVKESYSYAKVIILLGLIPAGGNYVQVKKRVEELGLPTAHFKGKGWGAGLKYQNKSRVPTKKMLVKGSGAQSYKLKLRLVEEGIKTLKCEICGWSKKSIDGRIPVELDHINGDKSDNRLSNLRILCPNCHSLQLTHRGKNKVGYKF